LSHLTPRFRRPGLLGREFGTKAQSLDRLLDWGLPTPDFVALSGPDIERALARYGIPDLTTFRSQSPCEIAPFARFLEAAESIQLELACSLLPCLLRSSAVPLVDANLTEFPSDISGAFSSVSADTPRDVVSAIARVVYSAYAVTPPLEGPWIESMGVVAQTYTEPIISGLAHSGETWTSVVWIEGHLEKIVSGESRGHQFATRLDMRLGPIVRGLDTDFSSLSQAQQLRTSEVLIRTCALLRQELDMEVEIEWLDDGRVTWIVQFQPLLGADSPAATSRRDEAW